MISLSLDLGSQIKNIPSLEEILLIQHYILGDAIYKNLFLRNIRSLSIILLTYKYSIQKNIKYNSSPMLI